MLSCSLPEWLEPAKGRRVRQKQMEGALGAGCAWHGPGAGWVRGPGLPLLSWPADGSRAGTPALEKGKFWLVCQFGAQWIYSVWCSCSRAVSNPQSNLLPLRPVQPLPVLQGWMPEALWGDEGCAGPVQGRGSRGPGRAENGAPVARGFLIGSSLVPRQNQG